MSKSSAAPKITDAIKNDDAIYEPVLIVIEFAFLLLFADERQQAFIIGEAKFLSVLR